MLTSSEAAVSAGRQLDAGVVTPTQPVEPPSGPAVCAHCELAVPAGMLDAQAEQQFCCYGCRTVYRVLHENGLAGFYQHRRAGGTDGRPALATGAAYRHFDEPRFHELYVTQDGAGSLSCRLLLEGVHCAACVWLIEKLPRLVPGVSEARLDLGKGLVVVRWDPAQVALSSIAQSIDRLGYPPHAPRADQRADLERQGDRSLLIRIAVAGACAGNIMLMAAALYGGFFQGMTAEYEALFRWASFALILPAVFWSGALFFKGAASALRARVPHMDIPISVGIGAGFAWGTYNTLRGAGEIYFDSVAALIFLLLVGRWIQRRYQRRAARAADLLYALAPSFARLVVGPPEEVEPTPRSAADGAAQVREVPLEVLQAGMLLEVRAGERVPVDGRVVSGESELDRSWLTGEAEPQLVAVGDVAHAGSVNLTAPIYVRAERTGHETRVGQLMQRVEEAHNRRAPVVLLADRLSGVFLLLVLAAAAFTLLVWWGSGPTQAVEHAVALLIVTCPCALGMATPLALGTALGRAAQGGLLIKGGDVLEALQRPHGTNQDQRARVVFDKTGTLTRGKLELLEICGDESVLPVVLAMERQSAHGIARAVVHELEARLSGAALEAAKELSRVSISERLGAGVWAELHGETVRIGNVSGAPALPAWAASAVGECTRLARSPVIVSVGDEIKLVLSVGDALRADASQTLRRLRDLGYSLVMLSGDHPATADAVAAQLAVPFEQVSGGVSPEQKAAQVEAYKLQGVVLMVGDGVNDAAALSAASVGIAVHGGAEASLQAADVFATRPGLEPVRQLVVGARQTLAVVRRNLVFSLAYNLVGVGLAVSGVLNPLTAAVLMPLSSLTVLASSLRSRSFRV